MATKLSQYRIKSFVGGLNSFANKTNIKDEESPDMLNMDFVGLRGIKKRNGYTVLDDEVVNGKAITGIFTYIKADGTYELLCSAGTNIYKWDGSTWGAVSGGTITDGATVNTAQLGDRLWICTGQDALQYYDGSTLSTTGIDLNEGEPVDPSICFTYGKRLVTNSTTAGKEDRFYIGGRIADDGTTTHTGDFDTDAPSYGAAAGYGKGKRIAGFATLKNYLYVFLQSGEIHQVSYSGGETGALTLADSVVSDTIGAVNQRSIRIIENDILFVWYDGVYTFGEVANFTNYRTKIISQKIDNLYMSIDRAYLSRIFIIYFNQRIYVFYRDSGTYNNAVLVFDTRYKSWLKWGSINADSACILKDTSREHLYFGSSDSSDSYAYELEQGTSDNNVAITSKYLTKCFDMGEFSQLKLYFDSRMLFGPVLGTVNITAYISDGSDTFTATTGTTSSYCDGLGSRMLGDHMLGADYNTPDGTDLDNPSNDYRVFNLDAIEGSNIQWEFSNNVLNENFQIEEIIGYFKPLTDRYVASGKEIT